MHNKQSTHFLILMLGVFALFISACKTTKSTFFTRSFHKTTTHYNWYFNANETYKRAIQDFEKGHKEDYNQLLPIFITPSEKEVKSISTQMDRAIKKSATAIDKHSILIKGIEHNSWIDDCYLLIGKSYFYKREYAKATQAFSFVVRQFDGLEIAYQASLWLTRTYINNNDISSAALVLDRIVSDEDFPVKLNKELSLIYAHYYIKLKDYGSAKIELEEALNLSKKNRNKARYAFILAQINQQQKEYSQATKFFALSIKKTPDYEMSFNAKINLARSFDDNENSDKIERELLKMLKDDKNVDYLDVIYFGLAELAMRQNNFEEAKPLYEKSVAKSFKNDAQKALSSLTLGQLLYDKKNYRPAQAYYDTAVAFMDIKHQDYKTTLNRQLTLNNLIQNLDIISREDSLQKIALMPELERLRFIDNLIKKIQEEERAQKELLAQQKSESNFLNDQPNGLNNRFNQSNQNIGGTWYFYNPRTLSFGFSEFSRKWGKRKLEDDWRRSNKQSFSFDEVSADTISEEPFDPKKKESYLKNLPLTVEQKIASNEKIIEAYFNAGTIYKNGLNDPNESINTFSELLQRFPNIKNEDLTLYLLYQLHSELGQLTMVEQNKQNLIQKHPQSEYTKLLSDPKYKEELMARKSELEIQYENIYMEYLAENYTSVANKCKQIISDNPNNPLVPQFDFLQTMAKGHKQDKATFVDRLRLIVETYPNNLVSESAQELIDYLLIDEDQTATKEKTEDVPSKDSKYSFKEDVAHYFLLLFNINELNPNLAKSALSNHHAEFYSLEKLNISDLLIDKDIYMVSVREFPSAKKAMMYYNDFQTAEVRGPLGQEYQTMVISAPNFPIFFKNKDLEGYPLAFKKLYLKE